ncbi:glycerate kinase [Pseudarthrobacter sp. So.54]
MVILSDVTTHFSDAARVFGPQKGADPATVELLTRRLEQQGHDFLRNYGRDPRLLARTGAAGGFSGGIWARYGAELVSGADYVLELLDFDEQLVASAAVVVGEGRLDSQTCQGKIIAAILARCGSTPVYAVVGSVGDDLGGYADNFA